MTESRSCAQCGTTFTPRREHSRFCSPECRRAWNRDHLTDAAADVRALEWSVSGMLDAAERLSACGPSDPAAVFSAVGEAVWWVTIVDARLVRQHLDSYDQVLDGLTEAERDQVEGTLTGLRFVRNQMGGEAGQVGFAEPAPEAGPDDPAGAWRWSPVPVPAGDGLEAGTRQWELTRHQAYEAWLVDRSLAETFGVVTAFLAETAGEVASASAAAPETATAAPESRLPPVTGRRRSRPGDRQPALPGWSGKPHRGTVRNKELFVHT